MRLDARGLVRSVQSREVAERCDREAGEAVVHVACVCALLQARRPTFRFPDRGEQEDGGREAGGDRLSGSAEAERRVAPLSVYRS